MRAYQLEHKIQKTFLNFFKIVNDGYGYRYPPVFNQIVKKHACKACPPGRTTYDINEDMRCVKVQCLDGTFFPEENERYYKTHDYEAKCALYVNTKGECERVGKFDFTGLGLPSTVSKMSDDSKPYGCFVEGSKLNFNDDMTDPDVPGAIRVCRFPHNQQCQYCPMGKYGKDGVC